MTTDFITFVRKHSQAPGTMFSVDARASHAERLNFCRLTSTVLKNTTKRKSYGQLASWAAGI